MLLAWQDVQKQIDEAKQSKAPPIEDLWNNIYLDPLVSTCYQQCGHSFCSLCWPYKLVYRQGLPNLCFSSFQGAKMRPMEIGLPKIQLPKGSGGAL